MAHGGVPARTSARTYRQLTRVPGRRNEQEPGDRPSDLAARSSATWSDSRNEHAEGKSLGHRFYADVTEKIWWTGWSARILRGVAGPDRIVKATISSGSTG